MGSVPTVGLNGTVTGAAGQTGCSEGGDACLCWKWNDRRIPSFLLSGSLLPVQDSVPHAGEGADFLSGCSRAAADEQHRSDVRRTADLEKKSQVKMFVLHSGSV